MENYLTKTELKQRGWTEAMMKQLLPEPMISVNPHCRRMKMYLWKESDVTQAEKKQDFQERIEKRKPHQERAQRAVKTKQEKMKTILLAAIEKIRVKKMDFQKVTRLALSAKRNWYLYTGQWENTAFSPDEKTIQRWTVNYIRHNLTEYDSFLFSVKGKTGISFAYPLYRKAVLEKIADVYPALREECDRQAAFNQNHEEIW
jgi:hypothetical protein